MTDTYGDTPTRFVTTPIRAQAYKRLASLLLAFPIGVLSAPWLSGSPTADYQVGQYTIGSFSAAIAVFGIVVVSLSLMVNALAGPGGLVTELPLRTVLEGADQ